MSFQDSRRDTFLDTKRRAHRFVRIQSESRYRADRFNPFRHILWEEQRSADIELGGNLSERATHTIHKWGLEYTYPLPETPFTLANQIRNTLLTSWINLALIFVPVGLSLRYAGMSSVSTFVCNYLAQFPLWFLSDYAMEEMEYYLGLVVSDLLDIITNNTVQVISSFVLLRANKADLMQTQLIGGILSNLLVLLGLSVALGGIGRQEQQYNRTSAHGSSSLLSIAATSVLIPTAVEKFGQTTQHNLILQSRGIAVVLLFVYFTYTIYQMGTHKKENMASGKKRKALEQQNPEVKVEDTDSYLRPPLSPRLTMSHSSGRPRRRSTGSDSRRRGSSASDTSRVSIEQIVSRTGAELGIVAAVPAIEAPLQRKGRSFRSLVKQPTQVQTIVSSYPPVEIHGPHLNFFVALFVFTTSIVGLYFCIDATVDSISALTDQTSLSDTFVGLILLPIPNCDFAPISLAVDDFLQQTMKYTVGRSIQTALLVEPMAVLIAWWIGVSDVTLAFDGFEVVSLFTTILLLNFLVVDARVHWVHGVMLLAEWVLIGIAAYFVTGEGG